MSSFLKTIICFRKYRFIKTVVHICLRFIRQIVGVFFNKIIQTFFPLISLSALLIGCFTIISKQNEIKVIILFPILSLLPYIAGGFGIAPRAAPVYVPPPPDPGGGGGDGGNSDAGGDAGGDGGGE